MRALAASFATLPAAQAARSALLDTFGFRPGHLRLASLGHATYPVCPGTVLAGSFDEVDVRAARDIVERFGGEVVTDVDTRWT